MIKTITGAYIAERTVERIYTAWDVDHVMLRIIVETRGGKQRDCVAAVNTWDAVGGEAYIARQLEKLVKEVDG